MLRVKRALISVFDKTGLIDLAKGLKNFDIEILSTGGTASFLRKSGIDVVEVSQHTGFPEILDGRVKTLHPKIHGGLLAVRDNAQHMQQIVAHQIGLIDMVVINLYPFEKVIKRKNVSLEEAIENIDIGGPAMIRSASKNFRSVAIATDPKRYQEILKELDANRGILPDRLLMTLAVEAFACTAQYDKVIHDFLSNRFKCSELSIFPNELSLGFSKVVDLRYGENPHQSAALYRDAQQTRGLARMKQLNGKELSYNNILDLDSAFGIIKEFNAPAAVIVKHNNPTGVAQDKDLCRAYRLALGCDKLSAFGGIVGLSRKVDTKTAQAICRAGFTECVIAPAYEQEALKILKQKKNLRIISLQLPSRLSQDDRHEFKKIDGGLLLQERDQRHLKIEELKVVTKRKPSKSDLNHLLFAWKVVKNIKSNAIVLTKGYHTVGIGCGQTSRVLSVEIAIRKAGEKAKGSFLASDAFIPKIDNVQIAAKAGVKAIIQTGGSIADPEVIQQADRLKMIMVTTGVRHFKH